MRAACLLAAVLLVSVPASSAAAAVSCPKTSLGAIESDVMCLQCGTPLAVAEDAPAAQRERAFISQMIAACQTKKQVEDGLVAQYGDRVLALPRAHGFALSAYLVPAAALIGGGALVALLGLRWRRARPERQPAAAVAADPAESAESARLDADLDRYRL